MEEIYDLIQDKIDTPLYWGLLPSDCDFSEGVISYTSTFLNREIITELESNEITFVVRAHDIVKANEIDRALDVAIRETHGQRVEGLGTIMWYFLNKTAELFEDEARVFQRQTTWALRFIRF